MLGLSILELHLFVAVLHLHGRHLQGSASSGGGASSSSGGVVSNSANGTTNAATAAKSGGDNNCAVAMVVRQALTVCDMLVEMFKQKVCVRCLVVILSRELFFANRSSL